MIQMRNVSFCYEEGKENGVHNISLDIPKGQCILLTGESGCGKTTLTRLINGLVPHFYSGTLTGEVFIAGQELEKWSLDELSTKVGSVFQNPRSQFFNLDTTGEIAFGCENLGWSRKKIHERIQKTIENLKIDHLMNKDIFSLSGGEKQMVAIASGYAMNPDIFVLDEPSANLDTLATQHLKQLLSCLKAEGKTIIIAEHRLYYLREIADSVLYMKNGYIVEQWTDKEFSHLPEEERLKRGLRSYDLKMLSVDHKTQRPAVDDSFSVENLSVCYKGRDPVLKGITCQASTGEIIAVIGHNGRGKSTFARCLCGLVRESAGSILYQGKRMSYKTRSGKIYLVMQDSNYQLFSDSVEGELALSTKDENVHRKHLTDWLLKKLSLEELKERHPMTLSGGQKQRLAIAAGIVQDADVMILDEPTSGLDFENMQRVKEIMKMIKQEGKRAFIITHDYEFLLATCDRVLEIDNGKIKKNYPVNEQNLSQLQRFFLQTTEMV